MRKIMKSMLAVAALFTVASASAQPARGEERTAEERAKQMSERMAERLDLNDAQKQQIYDLHIEYMGQEQARPERYSRPERGQRPSEEEMKAMKEAREAMMEERKARMDQMDAKIKDILTPDQYEKWKEMRSRGPRGEGDGLRMHDRGRGPHPGAAPGPDREPRMPRGERGGQKKSQQCTCNQ